MLKYQYYNFGSDALMCVSDSDGKSIQTIAITTITTDLMTLFRQLRFYLQLSLSPNETFNFPNVWCRVGKK